MYLIIIILFLLAVSFILMYLPLTILELRYKLSRKGIYFNTNIVKYTQPIVFSYSAKLHLTLALFSVFNSILYTYLLSHVLTDIKYELTGCLLFFGALVISIYFTHDSISDLYEIKHIVDSVNELN